MSSEQILFATLTATFAVVGIGLTIRNWFYGGSVIRVELDLARRDDWGALITGTVARWRQGDDEQLLKRIGGGQVDLVKVTLRNLGRTAATVHDIGLRAGRPPVPRGTWTAMANRLLEPGETSAVVRIEPHDAKIFYFHTMPILRGAHAEFGDGPLAFRAAVMTGVGKARLSPRWRRCKWNVWVIRGAGDRSIVDAPLSTREQARLWVELTEEVWEPSTIWVRQITNEAARLADAGQDPEAIYQGLIKLHSVFGKSDHADRDHMFMRALTDHLVELRQDASESPDEPAAES